MFNSDFYPTKRETLEDVLTGYDITGKVCFDPEGGKGNIVDYLQEQGAKAVISCEINKDLKKILQTKCPVIAEDFLTVTSDQISHVELIVMNPPFSADEKHILHAYEIAPKGCKIVALCNLNTIKNTYTQARKQLLSIVESCGRWEDLGRCFEGAERRTGVEVAVIHLQKPGENYSSEFDGFFTEEEPEQEQVNGIMSYNVVRDLVNRYIAAVKVYDRQLDTAVELNNLTKNFFGGQIGFQCTNERYQASRNEYKKDLQKAGWNFIFNAINLQKYATRGLKEDINKFVEQQQNIPFTMKNIYKMIEIVIGTTSQRIDRAILEVFEKLTQHHSENRMGLEGWKTNSHYLLNKKFIHPYLFNVGWSGQMEVTYHSDRYEIIDDLHKALCYISGKNYDEIGSFWGFNHGDKKTFNTWYDFGFFRVKGYKKGTAHIEFKDEDMWAKFNQNVARIKGYPLFEGKKQTKYQERQTGRAQQEKKNPAHSFKPTVLFEIKVA